METEFRLRNAREWHLCGATRDDDQSIISQRLSITHTVWKRPPKDWIKCNTDGSFHNSDTLSQAGWVLRDETGTYKGAVQTVGKKVQNVLESELQSILMALLGVLDIVKLYWRGMIRKLWKLSTTRIFSLEA